MIDFETFRIELLSFQLEKLNSYTADELKELLSSLTLEQFSELLIDMTVSSKLYDELHRSQKMDELLAEQRKGFKSGGVVINKFNIKSNDRSL